MKCVSWCHLFHLCLIEQHHAVERASPSHYSRASRLQSSLICIDASFPALLEPPLTTQRLKMNENEWESASLHQSAWKIRFRITSISSMWLQSASWISSCRTSAEDLYSSAWLQSWNGHVSIAPFIILMVQHPKVVLDACLCLLSALTTTTSWKWKPRRETE